MQSKIPLKQILTLTLGVTLVYFFVNLCWVPCIPIDGFHGAWSHFQRARVRVCVQCSCLRIQASKRYIKSLPLVLKDKRSCFS